MNMKNLSSSGFPGVALLLGALFGTILAVSATAPKAVAQENLFVNDAEPDTPSSVRDAEPWREGETRLPAWPREQDLIPLHLDGSDRSFQWFIDQSSLNTGADGVVRYTLVAESRSGARNLSFEGLRCAPRGEYRIYAYGHQGKFKPAGANNGWRRIGRDSADQPRAELWKHYLCIPRKFRARPHASQLRALKSGRVGEHTDTGFLNE
jgi:hypothetical protein